MRRKIPAMLPVITLVAAAVLLLPVTVPALSEPDQVADQEEVDRVFDELGEKFGATESTEKKLEIVQEFLSRFPDSHYTGAILDVGTTLMSELLDNHDGAIAYAREISTKVSDPEVVKDVRRVLIRLHSRPEYGAGLRQLADEMAALDPLSFNDHLDIIKAAAGAEVWEMILEHTEKARPLANAQAFESDFSDREYSDQYIQTAGRNRQGLLGTYEGWALANLDKVARALRTFAESESRLRFTYLGVPDNKLYHYWGQTLLMNAEFEDGLKMLSLEAIWNSNDEARTTAREVYLEQHSDEAGFEQYLADLRRESAKKIDPFTLTDYEDRDHSFTDLKGKVTLLAFWFPT